MTKRSKPKIEETLNPPDTSMTASTIRLLKEHHDDLRLRAVSLFYWGKLRPSSQEKSRTACLYEGFGRDNDPFSSLDMVTLDSLEHIEDIERNGLSDQKFFDLLQQNPLWLISEPFQEKIMLWQGMLTDPSIDEDDKTKAQARLKLIGNTLAFMGQGRKKKHDPLFVTLQYVSMMEKFEPIMSELNKCESLKEREKLFISKLPEYREYAEFLDTDKHTARSLAKAILMEQYGISEETVKDYLSKWRGTFPAPK